MGIRRYMQTDTDMEAGTKKEVQQYPEYYAWVRYEDYAALEQELAAEREKRHALFREYTESLAAANKDVVYLEQELARVRAALAFYAEWEKPEQPSLEVAKQALRADEAGR
jgi:hypothetical protein